MATVLIAGNVHLTYPNLPRQSQHTFLRLKAFPFGRYPLRNILPRSGDLAAWQPTLNSHQVIHCFNQIPLTRQPWLITFEQALPYDRESWLTPLLTQRLAADNCVKLIAISDYAKLKLVQALKNDRLQKKLLKKLDVVHPNFKVRADRAKRYRNGEPLNLIFVGNQFARKGGIVALRLAKKAIELKLPIVVHIISKLSFDSPTDHLDPSNYQPDLELLNLPNVVFHQQIPSSKVLELLAESHFQLMATLHDTYGYSVIEGFSVGTPAITTNVCALPELIHPNDNGYLLCLELDESRQWKNWMHGSMRQTDEYWQVLDSTFNNLADQALVKLQEFFNHANSSLIYEQLSEGALTHMKALHDVEKANQWFDQLYTDIAQKKRL